MKTLRRRRNFLWLVAGALLLSSLSVTLPGASAATTRTLAITTASAGPKVAFAAFDGNPPKLFDINGDGQLEIIAQNDNQYVYIFDSKNGTLLAEVKTNFPPGWTARSFNGPEAAIMSRGGSVHLVVANSAAVITSYRFDPFASTKAHFALTKLWERRLSDCFSNPGMDSKPVLADLDRDGRFEIVAGTEELGLFALRGDGTLLWKNCLGGGNAEPSVADLNLDGGPDVVHVSDAGVVTALDGRSGATMWSFRVLSGFNLGSGSMPVGATVAQLDGKGGPDVVVGARDSHDAVDWSQDHALLLALDSGGRLLWARQDPQGNPLTYTRPVIVDADKDGRPEVYWGDWNTIGHKPPFDEAQAWKTTGPAHFYRYDAAGTLVWRQTLDTWWSNKDLALADVDGDGVQEMLANGPNAAGHDGIWYLDVRSGAKEAFVDVHPWQVQRAPVVADLWGTGTMQWVLAGAPMNRSAGGHAILVFDTGAPFSAAWPHLPDPVLGTPPPPPSATFNATFTIKSPNQWWQEVFVKPETPRTITKVDVRIDGTFWRSMTLRTWGAWTSSYQTPAGTRVEFLATDSNAAVSLSAPFTWLDGTLTKGSVTPGDSPPPAPFTATYQVPPNVNEWWVEVKVTASDPVTSVEARVNNGAWTALTLQSWGNWAKSFFVQTGSSVQFRATSSTGAQNLSQTFTWLSSGGRSANFTATFQPCCTENNWWVEVKVTSTHPITKVEASVNSGPWTALSKTTWGTWAKSFFVADGSSVRFRATNDAGDTVISGTYTWV